MVATWYIGAANATGKKNVTTKKYPVVGGIEAEASRAMTRDEKDAKRDAAKVASRRLLNQKIGLHGLGSKGEPHFPVKIRIGHQRNAILMESQLTLGHPLDFGSVVKVIDMPVGDQK